MNGLQAEKWLVGTALHSLLFSNLRGSSEKETADGNRTVARRGKSDSLVARYITSNDLWKSRGDFKKRLVTG
jgi:hypothetical protein